MAGPLGCASLENELPIAVGAVDLAILPQVEIHLRVPQRSAAVATDSVFFDLNDLGRFDGHTALPNPG